jgi:hypothetical protein
VSFNYFRSHPNRSSSTGQAAMPQREGPRNTPGPQETGNRAGQTSHGQTLPNDSCSNKRASCDRASRAELVGISCCHRESKRGRWKWRKLKGRSSGAGVMLTASSGQEIVAQTTDEQSGPLPQTRTLLPQPPSRTLCPLSRFGILARTIGPSPQCRVQ